MPGSSSAVVPRATATGRGAAPSHATYALDVANLTWWLQGALARLLHKVAVVDDLPTADAGGRCRPHGGHA
ncbi:MAG: hypothetical protein U0R78_09730 [Nocardioidaceae bacterium]